MEYEDHDQRDREDDGEVFEDEELFHASRK
jgi:hypothetical protein